MIGYNVNTTTKEYYFGKWNRDNFLPCKTSESQDEIRKQYAEIGYTEIKNPIE